MPTNQLLQHIYRRIWQILGGNSQGTLQDPLPIYLHSTTTGHPMDPEHFSIVHKEVNSHSRTIKEAMFIQVQDPTLNRSIGKYQLPHIWDHLLMASPTLEHKPSSIPTTYATHLSYPPTGSLSSCYPYRWGKYTFMVSTHIWPKYSPYTPKIPQNIKLHPLYSSTILVSFSYFYLLD